MIVPFRIIVAESFLSRVIGLIGRSVLNTNEGIYLPRCRRIHTWFMRFPIDVVFIGTGHQILRIFEAMPPWRVSPHVDGAVGCFELAAHEASRRGLVPGGKMEII